MANTAIDIPFYVARDGAALTGAAVEMEFASLHTLSGIDKSVSAPAIGEIGGGWYKFSVAYGTTPFDSGDLVGLIDTDKDGVNGLVDADRFIPVEVRLDFYGLSRLVNRMSQDKASGNMVIQDGGGQAILTLGMSDGATELERVPQ